MTVEHANLMLEISWREARIKELENIRQRDIRQLILAYEFARRHIAALRGWKTHCKYNHVLADVGVYTDKHGYQSCRKCVKDRQKREVIMLPDQKVA